MGVVLYSKLVYNIINNQYTLFPLHPPLRNVDRIEDISQGKVANIADVSYGDMTTIAPTILSTQSLVLLFKHN